MPTQTASIALKLETKDFATKANDASTALLGVQIAAGGAGLAFKGMGAAARSGVGEMALGAVRVDALTTSLGKASANASLLSSAFGKLSTLAYNVALTTTAITGVAAAAEQFARIPQTLNAMTASGVSTQTIAEFNQMKLAIVGNQEAVEGFVISAIARLGQFEQAAARSATILKSSTRFDDNGNALRVNAKESMQNALSIQTLVNTKLDNAVTSTDALLAQYEVLSGGFSKQVDSEQVLETALKLTQIGAAGGVASNAGDNAKLLGKSLQAYSLSASDAARTGAILNATVENGITTIPELSSGFGAAGSSAKQAGISMAALGAGVATLTSIGQDTSEALTGFKGLSDAIINKTPEAAAELAKLSLNGERIRFDSAEVSTKGFTQALIDLYKATGNSPQALAKIFPNQIAYRAAIGLLTQDGAKYASTFEAVNGATAQSLDDVAKGASSTRVGEMQKLANKFGELVISIAQNVAPVVEPGLNALKKIADAFNSIPEPIKQALGQWIATQVVAQSAAAGIGILVKTLGDLAGIYAVGRVIGLAMTGQLGAELTVIKQLIVQRKGLGAVLLQTIGINQRHRLSVDAASAALANQGLVAKGVYAAQARGAEVAASASGKFKEIVAKNIAGARAAAVEFAATPTAGKVINTGLSAVDKAKNAASAVANSQTGQNIRGAVDEFLGNNPAIGTAGTELKAAAQNAVERVKTEAAKFASSDLVTSATATAKAKASQVAATASSALNAETTIAKDKANASAARLQSRLGQNTGLLPAPAIPAATKIKITEELEDYWGQNLPAIPKKLAVPTDNDPILVKPSTATADRLSREIIATGKAIADPLASKSQQLGNAIGETANKIRNVTNQKIGIIEAQGNKIGSSATGAINAVKSTTLESIERGRSTLVDAKNKAIDTISLARSEVNSVIGTARSTIAANDKYAIADPWASKSEQLGNAIGETANKIRNVTSEKIGIVQSETGKITDRVSTLINDRRSKLLATATATQDTLSANATAVRAKATLMAGQAVATAQQNTEKFLAANPYIGTTATAIKNRATIASTFGSSVISTARSTIAANDKYAIADPWASRSEQLGNAIGETANKVRNIASRAQSLGATFTEGVGEIRTSINAASQNIVQLVRSKITGIGTTTAKPAKTAIEIDPKVIAAIGKVDAVRLGQITNAELALKSKDSVASNNKINAELTATQKELSARENTYIRRTQELERKRNNFVERAERLENIKDKLSPEAYQKSLVKLNKDAANLEQLEASVQGSRKNLLESRNKAYLLTAKAAVSNNDLDGKIDLANAKFAPLVAVEEKLQSLNDVAAKAKEKAEVAKTYADNLAKISPNSAEAISAQDRSDKEESRSDRITEKAKEVGEKYQSLLDSTGARTALLNQQGLAQTRFGGKLTTYNNSGIEKLLYDDIGKTAKSAGLAISGGFTYLTTNATRAAIALGAVAKSGAAAAATNIKSAAAGLFNKVGGGLTTAFKEGGLKAVVAKGFDSYIGGTAALGQRALPMLPPQIAGALGPIAVAAAGLGVVLRDDIKRGQLAGEFSSSVSETLKKQQELQDKYSTRTAPLAELRAAAVGIDDVAKIDPVRAKLQALEKSGELTAEQFAKLDGSLTEVGKSGKVSADSLKKFTAQLDGVRSLDRTPSKGIVESIGGAIYNIPGGTLNTLLGAVDIGSNFISGTGAAIGKSILRGEVGIPGLKGGINLGKIYKDIAGQKADREADSLVGMDGKGGTLGESAKLIKAIDKASTASIDISKSYRLGSAYDDRNAEKLKPSAEKNAAVAKYEAEIKVLEAQLLAEQDPDKKKTISTNLEEAKTNKDGIYTITAADIDREKSKVNNQIEQNKLLTSDYDAKIKILNEQKEKITDPQLKATLDNQIAIYTSSKDALEKNTEGLKANSEAFAKYQLETLPGLIRALKETTDPNKAITLAGEDFNNIYQKDADGKATTNIKDIAALRADSAKYLEAIGTKYAIDNSAGAEADAIAGFKTARDNKITLPDGSDGFRETIQQRLALTGEIVKIQAAGSQKLIAGKTLENEQLKVLTAKGSLADRDAQIQSQQISTDITREKLAAKEREIEEFAAYPRKVVELEQEAAQLRVQVEQQVADAQKAIRERNFNLTQAGFDLQADTLKTAQAQLLIGGVDAIVRSSSIELNKAKFVLDKLIEDRSRLTTQSPELDNQIDRARQQYATQVANTQTQIFDAQLNLKKQILGVETANNILPLTRDSKRLEIIQKTGELQTNILNADRDILTARIDNQNAQLSNESSLANSAVKRASIELDQSNLKLKNIPILQAYERESLVLQQELTALGFKQQQNQLAISAIENQRSIKELQLQKLRLDRDKSNSPEIKAQRSELESQLATTMLQGDSIKSQTELLNKNAEVNSKITDAKLKQNVANQITATQTATIDNLLKSIGVATAKITENTERQNLAITAQVQKISAKSNAIEFQTKQYENQLKVLNLTQGLVAATADGQVGELGIMSNLTEIESVKLNIAKQSAQIKLASLTSQIQFEKDILELNIKQAAMSYQGDILKQQISEKAAARDVLNSRAALAKLDAKGALADPLERRAAQIDLSAKLDSEALVQSNRAIVIQQGQILDYQGNVQRQQLDITQRGKLQGAIADVAQTSAPNQKIDLNNTLFNAAADRQGTQYYVDFANSVVEQAQLNPIVLPRFNSSYEPPRDGNQPSVLTTTGTDGSINITGTPPKLDPNRPKEFNNLDFGAGATTKQPTVSTQLEADGSITITGGSTNVRSGGIDIPRFRAEEYDNFQRNNRSRYEEFVVNPVNTAISPNVRQVQQESQDRSRSQVNPTNDKPPTIINLQMTNDLKINVADSKESKDTIVNNTLGAIEQVLRLVEAKYK